MRLESCHGTSRIDTRDRAEPAPRAAPVWSGNTRIDSLEGLTGEARRRVHENNLRIRYGDVDRYGAYAEEFLRGARLCRTASELDAYGFLAAPAQDGAPGSTDDEGIEVFEGPWSAMGHVWLTASKDLGELRLRLRGKPVPLDVSLDVSATAKVEYGGRAFGGTWSAHGGAAPVVAIGAGGVGIAVKGGRSEVGLDAGLAGAKVTLSGDRIESVEVKARVLGGVAVHAKKTSGGIQEGLSVGGRLGAGNGAPSVQLEARASIGVNLLTPELVREALFGKSIRDGKD